MPPPASRVRGSLNCSGARSRRWRSWTILRNVRWLRPTSRVRGLRPPPRFCGRTARNRRRRSFPSLAAKAARCFRAAAAGLTPAATRLHKVRPRSSMPDCCARYPSSATPRTSPPGRARPGLRSTMRSMPRDFASRASDLSRVSARRSAVSRRRMAASSAQPATGRSGRAASSLRQSLPVPAKP